VTILDRILIHRDSSYQTNANAWSTMFPTIAFIFLLGVGIVFAAFMVSSHVGSASATNPGENIDLVEFLVRLAVGIAKQ